MLPAEKTHYRRGLTLGLTLAETFCVVVFSLLLACALLLKHTEEQRDEAEDQRDEAEEQLGEVETELAHTEEALNRGDTIGGAFYRQYKKLQAQLEDVEGRAKQAEDELRQARLLLDPAVIGPQQVADSLMKRSAELEAARDSLKRIESLVQTLETEQDSLDDVAAETQELREIVASMVAERHDSLSSGRVDSVVAAEARARRLARELRQTQAALRHRAAQLRDRDRLLADGSADSLARESERWRFSSDSLERELRELRGHGPPSCWLDAGRKPEYVFSVELTDYGMRLDATVPEHRSEEEAVQFVQRIEARREYAPADFIRLTRPFLDVGERDGCRFWVRIERGTENAAVLEERQKQVGRHFYSRFRQRSR